MVGIQCMHLQIHIRDVGPEKREYHHRVIVEVDGGSAADVDCSVYGEEKVECGYENRVIRLWA